jgi:hypothetical protein
MTEIKIFAEEWFSFPTMDLQDRSEGMSRGTRWIIHTILLMGLSAAMAVGAIPAEAADKLDRTLLPIPEPKLKPLTTLDARKATPPPRFEIKAPAGAPNDKNTDYVFFFMRLFI